MTQKPVICGLDEAGRGPLAGPLVAAAVFLPYSDPETTPGLEDIQNISHTPIRDSKKLTKLQRQRLFDSLRQSAALTFTSTISVDQINTHGIGWANKQIFVNLIHQALKCHSDQPGNQGHSESIQIDSGSEAGMTKKLHFIIDGNLKINLSSINPGIVNASKAVNYTIKSIPHADSLYPQVSLASIVAKVTRDRLMQTLHQHHPHYSWHTNMGYGTRAHIEALHQHGPTPHHRLQFVKTALSKYIVETNFKA